MTQKPVLRAEVHARALRASRNRKEGSLQRTGSIIPTPLPPQKSKMETETVHEIILKPGLKLFLRLFLH